ncbi:hypothetical protein ACFY0A_18530 [Streptomyces sp. NPDC001698]|uniref:hypothetical protein n=1 Tax=Streptomyces sp. NPDC001698 TaxID=3364601 RepID=UPI003673F83F
MSAAYARHQAALEAGADPAVVTQWINEAQRDKEAAQTKLDALPAVPRKPEPHLTVVQAITERLEGITQRIQAVDADKKGPPLRSPGHHDQLRKRNKDPDHKAEVPRDGVRGGT